MLAEPSISSGEAISILGLTVCCHIKRKLSIIREGEESKYYKEVTCKRVQTTTAGIVWSSFMSHGLLIALFTVL